MAIYNSRYRHDDLLDSDVHRNLLNDKEYMAACPYAYDRGCTCKSTYSWWLYQNCSGKRISRFSICRDFNYLSISHSWMAIADETKKTEEREWSKINHNWYIFKTVINHKRYVIRWKKIIKFIKTFNCIIYIFWQHLIRAL